MSWHSFANAHGEVVLPPGKYWIGDVSRGASWIRKRVGTEALTDGVFYLVYRAVDVYETCKGSDRRDYPIDGYVGIISEQLMESKDIDGDLGKYISSSEPVTFQYTDQKLYIDYGRKKFRLLMIES